MTDNRTPTTQDKLTDASSLNLPRRTALVTVAGLLSGVAGCLDTESASDVEDSDENTTDEQQESEQDQNLTDENETDSTNETSEEGATEDHETETEDEEETMTRAELVIDYDGEWSGTLKTENDEESISGTGSETFEIEGDDDSIMFSATISKDDNSTNTLLVEVIVDGKTVQSSSTNSQSGTVTVSYHKQTN